MRGEVADSAMSVEERSRLLREFGCRIVRLREERGWTRRDLAGRLGVTRERLAHWERGGHTPPLEVLLALSRSLAISMDELVTGEAAVGRALSPEEREEAAAHLEALCRLLRS